MLIYQISYVKRKNHYKKLNMKITDGTFLPSFSGVYISNTIYLYPSSSGLGIRILNGSSYTYYDLRSDGIYINGNKKTN